MAKTKFVVSVAVTLKHEKKKLRKKDVSLFVRDALEYDNYSDPAVVKATVRSVDED